MQSLRKQGVGDREHKKGVCPRAEMDAHSITWRKPGIQIQVASIIEEINMANLCLIVSIFFEIKDEVTSRIWWRKE